MENRTVSLSACGATRWAARIVGVAICVMVGSGFIASVASSATIATTEVPLNGLRTDVRTVETNLGNLVADAFLWQADQSGLSPTIAVVNGGFIRNNSIAFPAATPSAPVAIDDTFPTEVLPFDDTVVVVGGVSVATLLAVLENSVFASAPGDLGPNGRFLQMSGLRISWDPSAAPGDRVIDAMLGDGTLLIDDGSVVASMLLAIAMPKFISNGGDFYSMFPGSFAVTDTGVFGRDALSAFLQNGSSGLGGVVTAADYPPEGNARIVRVPAAPTLALIGIGLAGIGVAGRRKAH